jgi:RNA polymerase sigma factor (sigma-70 family)
VNAKAQNKQRRQTWAEVCLDFYPQLLATAHALTRDAVQSQDLVHETVLRFLTYDRDLEKIKAPLPYLLLSMRNVWIDLQRKHNKHNEVSLDDLLSSEKLEAKYLLVESDVLRSLENEELAETFWANVGPLTLHENRLLALWFGNYTADEIARALGEDVRVTRYDLNALKAKIRYRLKHKDMRRSLKNVP